MYTSLKNCLIVLSLVIIAGISSCTVGNKVIPEPGGGGIVDTTGTIGTFYLNLTGDTSYLLTVVAVDTIVEDSLVVIGGDLTIKDQVLFSIAKAEVGTYYTEQSPPGITGAVFIYRKRVITGYKNYAMLHGKIVITSVDIVTGVIKGSIDVNNEYVAGADKYYRLRGNFMIKVQV